MRIRLRRRRAADATDEEPRRTRVGGRMRDFGRAVAHRSAAPPQQPAHNVRAALSADVDAVLTPIRAVGQAVVGLLVEPDPPPGPPGRHPLAWFVRRSSAVLTVVAAAVFLGGMVWIGTGFRVWTPLVPVVAAILALPLLLTSATPLRAWRLSVVLGVVLPIFVRPRSGIAMPWPETQVLATLIVCFAVALRHHWRIVVSAWLATPVLAALAAAVAGASDVAGWAASSTGLFGVVMLIGYLVGSRGEMARRLDEGERQRAESETQRAVLEERARIARELHDVVAHHMSMISVQAETAPYRTSDLSEDGKAVLASIAETSREALADMRRLLGVLRDGQHGADRAPQPDLGQLDQLIAGARRAGLSVDLRVAGDSRPLLPGTELSAYRIVQESLSNVATHAPGAVVHVELEYGSAALEVRVVNEAPPEPTTAPRTGPGHGLLGMRERAMLLGGRFEAGPLPDGGYRVVAVLPLGPDGWDDDPAGAMP